MATFLELLPLAVINALFYGSSDTNFTQTPTVDWSQYDTDAWWGPEGERANQDVSIRPANVTYSDEMIADLRERLTTTLNAPRGFTSEMPNSGFFYGFNPSQVRRWLEYWNNTYDFRAREQFWNRYPTYRTNIQGLDIFYARVAPNPNTTKEVIPLLLLHGWPGSFHEFYDVVPLLTAESDDRDYVVDLIMPSMPAYGFSEAPVRPGLSPGNVAIVFRNLMRRLGYGKFYIQGGDFGASVNKAMATLFQDEVLGYHTNWGAVYTPVAVLLQLVGALYPPLVVAQENYPRMYPVTTVFTNLMTGTGYMHLQTTVPDTIAKFNGVAMTDSPAALLAYIFQIYATANNITNFARSDGNLWNSYDPDFLIDTVMYYWSTHSMATAMRMYAENFSVRNFNTGLEEFPTKVPTWVVQALYEATYQPPIILNLKFRNLINAQPLTVGGHFLALGEPEVFADSVLQALTAFREWHAQNGTDTRTSLN